MTWSETTWKRMEPIYQRISTMPFITELMDGTLAIDRFQFYMMQDAHYLEHFGRVLALIGTYAGLCHFRSSERFCSSEPYVPLKCHISQLRFAGGGTSIVAAGYSN